MPSAKTIRVTGIDKVLKGLSKFSEEKKRKVDQIFKDGANDILRKALRNVPVDEAALKRSGSVKKADDAYEVTFQSEHAAFMEFGTKKNFEADPEFADFAAQFRGGNTGGGDFDQAILEWVKRKGIKFEKAPSEGKRRKQQTVRSRYLTAEQTAFIIARFIAFHGVKAHPYLLPAFKEVREEIINKIMKEIT